MHISRILIIAGLALAVVGCLMPWAEIPILGSVAGSKGDGWFPVIFLGVPFIFAFLGTRSEGLSKGKGIATLVLGVFATLFMVWKVMEFGDLEEQFGDLVEMGLGIWVELAGSAVATVGGFLSLKG